MTENFKFCPKCFSKNLKMAVTPWKAVDVQIDQYTCFDCKFEGIALEGEKEFITLHRKKFLGEKK
jgi:hypothetical protein